jgi:hypothetical protein
MPQPARATLVGDGCGIRGPPATDFKTIDAEILEYTVMELEASQKLGRVHKFIRDNRHQPAASISDGVRLLLREIQEYIIMNGIRSRQSSSWAGMIVSIRCGTSPVEGQRLIRCCSAAIQLLCFFADKQGFFDEETARALHSNIEQIGAVVSQCRIFNGFTEDYTVGVQPTWSSISYMAIRAYRLIEPLAQQYNLRHVDLSVCLEALQMMAPRYKLAGEYRSNLPNFQSNDCKPNV